MSSNTTISDVARAAKTSPSAVSFVLNGKADKYRISPATQARIRAAIQATGYQPDPVARDIALGRSAAYFAKMAESDLRHQTSDIRPKTLVDQLSAEALIPEPAVEDTPPLQTPAEPSPVTEPTGEMPTPVSPEDSTESPPTSSAEESAEAADPNQPAEQSPQ